MEWRGLAKQRGVTKWEPWLVTAAALAATLCSVPLDVTRTPVPSNQAASAPPGAGLTKARENGLRLRHHPTYAVAQGFGAAYLADGRAGGDSLVSFASAIAGSLARA